MSNIIINGYNSTKLEDSTNKLRLVAPEPLFYNNWKIPRWWSPINPCTFRGCARVDLYESGSPDVSIYIDGNVNLFLDITWTAGSSTLSFDASSLRSVHRILVLDPADRNNIINETIANYDDYEWDSSKDQLVLRRFGSGAPLP